MLRPWALAVPLLLLSGCGGTKPAPTTPFDPTTGAPTTVTIAARAERPDWDLGQHWTYAVETPGKPTRTFRMAVAENRAELWVVASDDRSLAMHHAVYSTNPVLGRINKETLAPYQAGEPVRMYEFPLLDGKKWEGKFFGDDMTFTARFGGDVDVSHVDARRGLGRVAEGFHVSAQAASGRKVLYDFVESVGWFANFEVLAADGSREIRLTLTDLGKGFKGAYYFYRGTDAIVRAVQHAETEAPGLVTIDGDVPADFAQRVALGFVYVGSSGTVAPSVNATVKEPGGSTVFSRDFSGVTQLDDLADVPGATGKWTIDLRLLGNSRIEARVAGIQAFAEGQL